MKIKKLVIFEDRVENIDVTVNRYLLQYDIKRIISFVEKKGNNGLIMIVLWGEIDD